MTLHLSEKLKTLADSLPCPVYLVGGYVRNALCGLDLTNQDMDISAPLPLEKFVEYAKKCGFEIRSVYKNTGTAKIVSDEIELEFSSFRHDEYVRGHKPSEVCFTEDIMLDCRRRDFCCNAIYYDIKTDTVVDPLGGCEDIKLKRLRTVTDADKVFSEDGLRLMRLVRFYAQMDFYPDEQAKAAAIKNIELLRDISVERIFDELKKILVADTAYGNKFGHYKGLKLMQEIGALKIILPELALGENVPQNPRFHNYDVLEHSFKAAAYADKSIRLAALLHDVGKPECYRSQGNFFNHEQVGAEISVEILKRLKASKREISEVERLVFSHMYDFRCDARENKIRKYIVKYNDIFDKILLLKQADYSACKDDLNTAPSVVKFRKIYENMTAENAPKSLKELKIKGNDLKELGFKDRQIGEVLEELLTGCAIGNLKNDRRELIAHLKRISEK